MTINARQFPGVYEHLEVNVGNMGCVMLNVEPMEIVRFVEGGADDLYYSELATLPFAQGPVGEASAHVTLLYGLMESAQTTWRPLVDQVLEGWEMPDELDIEKVGYFPGSVAGEDYSVIVGHIAVDDKLIEGHQRLELLPHINTFPSYEPHVTLAYVKNGEGTVEKWVKTLNGEFKGRPLKVTGIDYGV